MLEGRIPLRLHLPETMCNNQYFNEPTRSNFQMHMREALRTAKERQRHRTHGPQVRKLPTGFASRIFGATSSPKRQKRQRPVSNLITNCCQIGIKFAQNLVTNPVSSVAALSLCFGDKACWHNLTTN